LGEFSPLGRLFSLASLLKFTEVAQILGLLFPKCQLCINFDKKIVWATFSKTHLVTLLVTLSETIPLDHAAIRTAHNTLRVTSKSRRFGFADGAQHLKRMFQSS
jgi:hypothetical protein